MNSRSWWCAAALLLAVAGGCKKKHEAAKPPEKPVGSGTGTAVVKSPSAVMTGEEMAAQYATCWGYFNDRKWDEYTACFTADAESQDVDQGKHKGVDKIVTQAKAFAAAFPDGKAEVELTLVSDQHCVGIVLFTGTHDGPLPTQSGKEIAPTHKKIGFLMGHVIDFDRKTRLATGQYGFADPSTLMGQLGIIQFPHREPMTASLPEKGTVAVAANTAVEQANQATLLAGTEAFNKHDVAASEALRAPGMTFYDSATPNDVTMEQWREGVTRLFAQFSDLKSNVGGAFAAGDYTVSFGELVGTNDGPISPTVPATGKSVKLVYLNIGHYTDGKLDKAWRFVNGLSMPMQLGLMK